MLLLPNELSYLITAFLPSQPAAHRSKSYLVLSSFCQGVRHSSSSTGKNEPDPATESLGKFFAPLIIARLEKQKEEDVLVGVSFLTALFQVDWQAASSILLQDGIVDLVADIHDLFASPQLSLGVAHLLGQAGGYKPCRAAMSAQSLEWLQSKSRQTADTALRAAAAIALVKLSRGAAADAVDNTNPQERLGLAQDEELAKLMKEIVITENDQSSLADAIEGLAYLSVDPVVKEALSGDPTFLSQLFAQVPRRKSPSQPSKEINSTILYGILVIIANISAYRPRLSAEDAQIDKLRRMAKASKDDNRRDAELDILNDDEHAKQRCRRLITGGALNVLTTAPLTESRGIRVNAGKVFLSFVEDKGNRGKILQSGGAKALMQIIRHALAASSSESSESTPSTMSPLDVTDLEPIQALAKLAITASPVQVFGPNEGAVYDAIRPFSLMLLHPSSNLLQRFETIMALTNLSSQSPEVAARVAKADGLLNKVELLLLEQHPLIRRAAMELICNLIAGSAEVFERYGGAEDSRGSKSKLQILLALSDVDDLPTRLAASGALATLTVAPSACRGLLDLQRERRRVLPILTQLIDPSIIPSQDDENDEQADDVQGDPGLVHRGVVCTRNFLLSIDDLAVRKQLAAEASSAGLVFALAKILKDKSGADPVVAMPAAEILKRLMEVSD
jgi:hypothetical protein